MYELRNLHKDILDEPLPASMEDLLIKLEAKLQAADGHEAAPLCAARTGADSTDPTDEDE